MNQTLPYSLMLKAPTETECPPPPNGDFQMTLANYGSVRILLFPMIKYIYQANLITLASGGKEWLGMPFGRAGAVPGGNWDKSQSF